MVYCFIKNVWDLAYANPEEIADAENAKELINQYSGDKPVPIRILEIGDRSQAKCIVLAGEGALYPWKVGQSVVLGFVRSFLECLRYLRDLCVSGIDNSPYQDFVLYDSIKPIRLGEHGPDKGAKEFKGIYSFGIFTKLARILTDIHGGEDAFDKAGEKLTFININDRHFYRRSK